MSLSPLNLIYHSNVKIFYLLQYLLNLQMNSEINKILSISPVDGRYKSVTQQFSEYFSEFALIKYRVYVEIEYFLELTNLPIKDIDSMSPETKKKINLYSLNRFGFKY